VNLTGFNQAPAYDVRPRLLALTDSPAWADALIAGRPYADAAALLAASDRLVAGLPESEIDAALAGHPRIGERAGPGLGVEQAARSSREQSGMASADDELKQAMAEGNASYERRFGRIYLVAAAGRSAEELLAILQERLGHDPAAELDVVREQLARITRLRLGDLLGDLPGDSQESAR
jgi:2-oxo-4-hydroxy-4-carboxy-5-ureidoimidazoline decarboxylase